MSDVAKVMAALVMLPRVREAAMLLVSCQVMRPEDADKCVRIYVKKHPEIQQALDRAASELP